MELYDVSLFGGSVITTYFDLDGNEVQESEIDYDHMELINTETLGGIFGSLTPPDSIIDKPEAKNQIPEIAAMIKAAKGKVEGWHRINNSVIANEEMTRISGLWTNSIHLDDEYFKDSRFGIPCVVCHGMTGTGRVGPPNSFRFPAGAAQLQYYKALSDTTFTVGELVGGELVGRVAIQSVISLIPKSALAKMPGSLGRTTNGSTKSVRGWMIRPEGTRLKQVGNYWIKEVDPDASYLRRVWGQGSLNAQARALDNLSDLAPSHLFRNGKLVIRDVGRFNGSSQDYWRIWAKGSYRLRTPFNDIRPRNIGLNGQIFDPAQHPVHQAGQWVIIGGTAVYVTTQGYINIMNDCK